MAKHRVGATMDTARVELRNPVPDALASEGPDHIGQVLEEMYGTPSKRKERLGEDPNRAHIIEVGYAGCGDAPESLIAYNVNVEDGSLALAEGTGADTGTATAVRSFTHAMWAQQTQHTKHIGRAVGQVQEAVDNIPRAIMRARKYQKDTDPTTGKVVGAQLFDKKLIVSGQRPVFVYDLQTRDCEWINSGSAERKSGSYVHTFNHGQHFIVMSSGRTSDEGLSSHIMREAIEEILASQKEGSEPLTAQIIAEALNERLATDESKGSLLVSRVNLAPWEDRRPFWKKLGDYTVRIPSTVAYGMAAYAVEKKRRQLYETRTTAGRLGRVAAIAGDLALNAGFLTLAYSMTRAGMGAAHEASSLIASGPDLPLDNMHLLPTTETPSNNQPSQVIPQVIEAYAASRVATAHDPLSHNHPSTVWNWSQDALRHYGQQEGLPQKEIDKLIHDDHIVSKVNQAFYHDTSDPDNKAVADDPKHWLDAGDKYSQVDQGEAAHEEVLERKHDLGMDTPPPQAVTEPVNTPPPTAAPVAPAPTSSPPATEARILNAYAQEYWLPAAAAGGVAAVAVAAASQVRRSRRKKRDELIADVASPRHRVLSHNAKRRTRNGKLLTAAHLPLKRYRSAESLTGGEEAPNEPGAPVIVPEPRYGGLDG